MRQGRSNLTVVRSAFSTCAVIRNMVDPPAHGIAPHAPGIVGFHISENRLQFYHPRIGNENLALKVGFARITA